MNRIAVDYVTARLSGSLRSSCNVSVRNYLMGFKYTLRCVAAWRTDSIRRGHITPKFERNLNLSTYGPDAARQPADFSASRRQCKFNAVHAGSRGKTDRLIS